MEWSFLLLTLIAAVLIGYILGRGNSSLPHQSVSSIIPSSSSSSSSASPSDKKSKRSKRKEEEKKEEVEAKESASATSPSSGTTTEESKSRSASPVAATVSASPDSPSPRDRRSSSVSSASSSDDLDLVNNKKKGKKLVIVAKQLPILTRPRPGPDASNPKVYPKDYPKFVLPNEDGTCRLYHSEWEDNRSFLSGLAALQAHGYDITWVGVPNTGGVPVPHEEREEYEDLVKEFNCVPVYLTPDLHDKMFNGFCKGVLWPMLHYVLPQSNQQFSASWEEMWQAYNAANAAFSTVISRCVESPTDTIWVHNYHLLLLPSLLRRKLPRAKIGLFIHTPFPSSDVFRVLPTRHNILSSIMASDLLGFHTFDYARHFLSCIKRVMDLDFETLPGGSLGIKYSGRFVSILIRHVGIDSQMFDEMRRDEVEPKLLKERNDVTGEPEVREQTVAELVANLKAKYYPRRLIISAGDLDSVKGGLLKFQAYKRFLDTYPQFKDTIVFIEMLLPNSSVKFDHTRDLKVLLDEQIAEIKATHGPACIEVMELPEVLSLRSVVAYYRASDVCIASQFWDGLNLLPFEYTASQGPVESNPNPGALIISEFAGCSRVCSGVIRVNPWNLDDVAAALRSALEMTQQERAANHQRRYKYVMDHTIVDWGLNFLQHLDRATKLCEGMNYVQVGWGSNIRLVGLRSDFTHLDYENVQTAYRRAERRVLFLDYDGTLTPAEKSTTGGTVATRSRLMGPSRQVKKLLHALTHDHENIVFIMSGRTRVTLNEWFPTSEFPELGLAAEKGLFLRWPQRLTFLCRADLRRDVSMRKRMEESFKKQQEERKTKEEQRAKQSPKQLTESERDSSDGDSESKQVSPSPSHPASPTPLDITGGSISSGGENSTPPSRGVGDAHLLLEESFVPVEDTEWEYLIGLDDVSWKSMALAIIREYTEQTDGSWIEDKEFAIVFHYEQADPEYGRMQASELQKYLVKILANPSVDVIRYDYNRILEVKPHGVSKGLAATAILEELFQMHQQQQKLCKISRPPSPGSLSQIEEGQDDDSPKHITATASPGGLRSARTSTNNLSGLSSPTSPTQRTLTNQVFGDSTTATSSSASQLPPFLFCVGDDRSDEDMFLAVQNKDYLEGKLRGNSSTSGSTNMHHHSHAATATSLPSQSAVQRSMSAAPASTSANRASSTSPIPTSRTAEDEIPSHIRSMSGGGPTGNRRGAAVAATRISDPCTFTVCVGMKPSNAHYYLHDDEEVVRLLSSLATSSQRIAQTRTEDQAALVGSSMRRQGSLGSIVNNPSVSPPPSMSSLGGSSNSLARAFNSGSMTSLSMSHRPPSSASLAAAQQTAYHPSSIAPFGSLRPQDIPTSPHVPQTSVAFPSHGHHAASSSTSAFQRAKQFGNVSQQQHQRSSSQTRSSASNSEAEDDDADEDDDDDDVDVNDQDDDY